MINKLAIKELVKQLREHSDTQIREQMFDTVDGKNCYCAEGIMAKVYCEMNNIPYSIKGDIMILNDNPKYWVYGTVSDDIDNYFSSPNFLTIGHDVSLLQANDTLKLSFNEIAQKLEAKYLTPD